jgi:hypothetical protein
MSEILLAEAFAHVEDLGDFEPSQRVHWLAFRKLVENWPQRHLHPGLDQAFRAVADCPEYLTDEAERWEELRHQAAVLLG